MNKLNALDWIALVLLAIGGINWGLVGIFDFDLVATLLGDMSLLSRTVYTVVGVCALYVLATSAQLGKRSS
jgi:uncharacterized membrane protein YuzA (DUF378 family)